MNIAPLTDYTGRACVRRGSTWADASHSAAVLPTSPGERTIVAYCRAIQTHLESVEADEDGKWRDWVLGPCLGQIIDALRGLLDGDIGRLDAGTVDAWLCDTAHQIGWDTDTSTYTG